MIRRRLAEISKHKVLDLFLIGISVATLVSTVTVFVISREGDITWDDACHLFQSFEAAQMARDRGTWEPLRAIKYASGESSWPPFQRVWIAQSWLLFGSHSIIPVPVFFDGCPHWTARPQCRRGGMAPLRFACGTAFVTLPGHLPYDALSQRSRTRRDFHITMDSTCVLLFGDLD
jgi:hypothetical protein